MTVADAVSKGLGKRSWGTRVPRPGRAHGGGRSGAGTRGVGGPVQREYALL